MFEFFLNIFPGDFNHTLPVEPNQFIINLLLHCKWHRPGLAEYRPCIIPHADVHSLTFELSQVITEQLTVLQ